MSTETLSTTLTGQWVTVNTPDGPMEAYLSQPIDPIKTHPAVLLWMEIFGVNRQICEVADRLAQQGYTVLAPNYFHRSTQNVDLPYNDQGLMEGRRHKDLTSRHTLKVDFTACRQYLSSLPGHNPEAALGMVGFCYGGNVAYTLAIQPKVAVAVCFYPGGVGEVDNPQAPVHATADIQGHMLLLYGGQDELIPPGHRQATQAALQQHGVSHQVVVYPQAGHGFFCEARADYNPDAANDAWARVMDSLSHNLPKSA
jgi:carboxymethylenebutenolidase